MKKNTRDDTASAAARRLAAAMAKLGKPITHTQALTALAAMGGDANRHIAADRAAKTNDAGTIAPPPGDAPPPADRRDEYRFDAAMREGAGALLQAFGKHSYKLDDFADRHDAILGLAGAFDGTMRRMFPDGSPGQVITPPIPRAATTPAAVAKQALSKLIDAIVQVDGFEDLEAGCDGHGPLVEACEAIGKPLPAKLAAWLAEDAERDETDEADAHADDGTVPSADDQADFAGFCRQATDQQIVHVRDKERKAGRKVYELIAKNEGSRRGIDMD